MRPFVVPLTLLFIALGDPSYAQSVEATTAAATTTGDVDDLDYLTYFFDVGRPIQLNCSYSKAPPDTTYTWTKNDTEIEQVEMLKDRYEKVEGGAVLRIRARTHEDDYGNYTCKVGDAVARAWRVHARPVAKLPANVNVVEGQKLKVTCRLIGKPYPPVQWLYAPTGSDDNVTRVPVERVLGARVQLQDSPAGVPRGVLVLDGATRDDAGNYTCGAEGGPPAHTILRVKGMYDALWPFLGICAEVFVLCAIILVYEKRRTKPELDDSDTDNHDQ